jgi:hypothetical protein
MAQLDDDTFPKFEHMPVGFQGYPAETGTLLLNSEVLKLS